MSNTLKVMLLILLSEIWNVTGQILFKKSTNAIDAGSMRGVSGHVKYIQNVLTKNSIWMGFSFQVLCVATWLVALAQADLEDREEETVMYDIDFEDEKGKPLTISTTRPELIFACAALYVNPTDKRYKKLIGKDAIVPLVNRKVKIRTHQSVEKR